MSCSQLVESKWCPDGGLWKSREPGWRMGLCWSRAEGEDKLGAGAVSRWAADRRALHVVMNVHFILRAAGGCRRG